LNEGFTVFIERKITSRVNGERVRHFNALLGLSKLQDDVSRICTSHPEYTCLCPKLKGVDPDDVFSSVPYEKGFNFLFYLEQLVGGPAVFEPYLRKHVEKFSHTSITTDDFKTFLFEYFGGFDGGSKVPLLESVDWNAWLHRPGMPPVTNDYDRFLADQCQSLADEWTGANAPTNKDRFEAMGTSQRVFFLDLVSQKAPLSEERLEEMNALYQLDAINNSEVKFKWQTLCLLSQRTSAIPRVVEFITTAGRMKYVRPLYRSLAGVDKNVAVETFESNRTFYHPICAAMVSKDLGLVAA